MFYYFNLLHKGHIEYFHLSKSNGDILIVIVNNDKQRMLKGSKKFMDEKERILIIKELKVVDEVLSIDNDKTVIKSIEKVYNLFSPKFDLFLQMVEIKTINQYLRLIFVKN